MSKKHKITTNSVSIEDGWDSGVKTAKFCGRCDIAKLTIFLLPAVDEKIQAMNDTLDKLNIEWLGYLLGEKQEDGAYRIDDVIIPEQVVSGASVQVTEKYSNERLIGTVHLHPFQNGKFFSETDEEKIGENHDVMIVTTPRGEYKGSARYFLECDALMQADAEVEVLAVPNPELDEFLKAGIEKIKVKKFESKVYQANEPKSNYSGHRYCGSCRQELLQHQTTHFDGGVEYCLPCYHRRPSNTTEGGMKCHDCEKHTVWSMLEWEQGVARCKPCHTAWKENVGVGNKSLVSYYGNTDCGEY